MQESYRRPQPEYRTETINVPQKHLYYDQLSRSYKIYTSNESVQVYSPNPSYCLQKRSQFLLHGSKLMLDIEDMCRNISD